MKNFHYHDKGGKKGTKRENNEVDENNLLRERLRKMEEQVNMLQDHIALQDT